MRWVSCPSSTFWTVTSGSPSDRHRNPRPNLSRKPGDRTCVETHTTVRNSGAHNASNVACPVKRDLSGATVKFLQHVGPCAEGKCERRPDGRATELHRLLDEEVPRRSRCRRFPDDRSKGAYEAAVAEDRHPAGRKVHRDAPPGRRGCRGGHGDPPGVAVRTARKHHAKPVAPVTAGSVAEYREGSPLAGDRTQHIHSFEPRRTVIRCRECLDGPAEDGEPRGRGAHLPSAGVCPRDEDGPGSGHAEDCDRECESEISRPLHVCTPVGNGEGQAVAPTAPLRGGWSQPVNPDGVRGRWAGLWCTGRRRARR